MCFLSCFFCFWFWSLWDASSTRGPDAEPSLPHLRLSWGPTGATLGPSSRHLGLPRAPLGPSLGLLGGILADLGAIFSGLRPLGGRLGAILGQLGPSGSAPAPPRRSLGPLRELPSDPRCMPKGPRALAFGALAPESCAVVLKFERSSKVAGFSSPGSYGPPLEVLGFGVEGPCFRFSTALAPIHGL